MTAVDTGKTPASQGFRMPAEWEPQAAVWLQWPGEHPLARGSGDLGYQMLMEKTWLLLTRTILEVARVGILAQSETQAAHLRRSFEYFGFDTARIDLHVMRTADVWHRDSGPVFIVDESGDVAVTDWNFNGWGSYPQWGEIEGHIPRSVGERLGLPVFTAPLVSEGGAFEVNGSGSLLATRSSIVNGNRNPGHSETGIEQALKDYLGLQNIIWLSGAPPEVCENELGDGTDYHIDIAARFTGRNTVLYAWTDDESDPRYPYLVRHREELAAATDETGASLTLEPLALPHGGVYSIGARHDPLLGAGSGFTDASYLNYLVCNGLVLVPAFGNRNDAAAQQTLARCFPGHRIVPVPVVSLTAEGGAIHCVTQQQPAGKSGTV